MSFILDALKKAERERNRVPTLATVHGPPRETVRAIGLWVAAGVLLAGGGVLIWLLWPSSNVGPPAATDLQSRISPPARATRTNPDPKIASAKPADNPLPTSTSRIPRSPDIGKQGKDLSVPGGVPGSAGRVTPSERRRAESKPIEPRQAEPRPVEVAPATPRPAEPPSPPGAQPSPGADQARVGVVVPSPPPSPSKPSTLQEAMAKMTLDVFVYTDVKTERMVVINGRRYVQGQYVDGVYLLEDITAEGAVLSYQGEHALLRP
jgi:hypothetical protein